MTQKRMAVGAIVAIAVGTLLAAPATARAQYTTAPEPAAYALENVTLVQADGRRTEGVTVVVRGRLIETLGRGAQAPADARILDGDSLFVYPGFIDGDGRAPFEFPRPDVDRRQVEIWNAPRQLRGFMPARRVVSHLTADGAGLAPQRRAGLVAAAVHPTGAMMPGRGTLLLYRQQATPEQLVIEPALGPRFEFRGGQGVYPATLFGVMASIRQAFEDARHHGVVAAAHARDPRGLTTPTHDEDFTVLRQVLAGDLPVFFRADGATDILRVLSLADEYGFRPIVVGGAEAWAVADELRRRRVPVIVTVDFPEPRRWDPKATGSTDDPAGDPADEPEGDAGVAPPSGGPAGTAGASASLDAAAQREKDQFENRYANAGRLAAAGVTFALASGGSGELLEGVRKAIEYGLSEDAALAALTRTPADLFGVGHLVRLEPGLPATFIVASGPLFDRESRILHTFVEGRREAGADARAAVVAGSADEAAAFGGEWRMTIDAAGQIMSAVLTIEQDGATFTGSMSLEGQRLPLSNGVIDGDKISVVATMEQGGQTLQIRITGTVDGDQAAGDADAGPLGMANWRAERVGPGGVR